MINNRTQLDKETIDWKSVAFGVGKYRRKTVGFGKYNKKTREYEDEIYLRELSIIDGGIGCALWDAAIILARWMRENQSLFENKVCIELGSGVGLPGILASRWCSRVYLTDYIENILLNLEYNIHLNTTIDDEDERNDELVDKINLKKKMKDTAIVKMLNWYEIDNVKMEQADIILGSELTYTGNEKTINSLVKVVDKLLKKDGIFIEILSDNRDVSHYKSNLSR